MITEQRIDLIIYTCVSVMFIVFLSGILYLSYPGEDYKINTETCKKFGYDDYVDGKVFMTESCMTTSHFDHHDGRWVNKFYPFEECTQFPRDKELCGDE